METGIRADKVLAEPLGDDAAALAGYTAMSAKAVISLLLGMASPVAVLGTMLLVVPLAGATTALLALRQIADGAGQIAGRRAALCGLALSVVCGFAVVSHSLVTRSLRTSQAEAYGRLWLSHVLAGDLDQAYRIGTGSEKQEPDATREGPPQPDPYSEMLRGTVVQALVSAGADAEVRDGGVNIYERDWGGEFSIRQRFLVTPKSKTAQGQGPGRPIAIFLVLQRKRIPGQALGAWRVNNVEFEKDAREP